MYYTPVHLVNPITGWKEQPTRQKIDKKEAIVKEHSINRSHRQSDRRCG
jgi:hypothetical protein